MNSKYEIKKGSPRHLGLSLSEEGVNFAFHAIAEESVSLLLFAVDQKVPFASIPLHSDDHKTGTIWHVLVLGLPEKFHYGIKIKDQILLDPYATSLNTGYKWGDLFYSKERVLAHHGRSHHFDWEGTSFPKLPFKDLIIYEMHVRGFTRDPSSYVQHPGTFNGVVEKISHLKELGVNAIELLPIFEFNECENFRHHPETGERLFNYWGYSTVNFFTLMHRFSSTQDPLEGIKEFKNLVKECHRQEMEVILDVVYNHTAEGGPEAQGNSFRGLDEKGYYMVGPGGEYLDYSGCGNTFNGNYLIATNLIIDSLRYFVSEMHIDGFRFDLASALTRGVQGNPLASPPLIERISKDPVLSEVKLIAEAWDAAGLYQVGNFPSYGRWAEWNGVYRDVIRSFIKGDEGKAGAFADAVCGSYSLYGKDRKPYHSINFITSHDGFTLQDLVSYNGKHNLSNGEENLDGISDNISWNCGDEGDTSNVKILRRRERQKRNLIVALMVSLGTPMILMGDEYGHTKKGNNNAWCHDNVVNWFQWDRLEEEERFFRFFKKLVQFRRNNPIFCRNEFLESCDIDWHGYEPYAPNWDVQSRFVAYTLKSKSKEEELYIAFNTEGSRISIRLPELRVTHKKWHRFVDTALASPHDIMEKVVDFPYTRVTYQMEEYSSVIFIAL